MDHERLEGTLSALLMAVIERNPEAVAVSTTLVRIAARMAEGLSTHRRYIVAERMRDAADLLETGRKIQIRE